ncbi:hypothetical protein [Kitasatospora sp. NPDC088346]|uniref:hypothetical protein n=1 Tax=Kitasatospora sp. NPDC088346 TaxID=3364073 RepID=UPI0037F366F7
MFGHNPVALAELVGDTIRLTVDHEQSDSPVIELSVAELRHLLAGAERDLTDFYQLAANWIAQHLPDQAVRVTAALADALICHNRSQRRRSRPSTHPNTDT